MMNTMKKTTIATLIGATAIFAGALTANAAEITSYDQKFTMETPNDSWKEIDDSETVMTLTNGSDYVLVNRYDKDAVLNDINVLPMPTVAHDKYEEEFLAYYSTDKDVYMITGLADKADDIGEVRAIVNSIQLADHKKPAAPKQQEKQEENPEEKKDEIVKTDEMYTLYNEAGNTVLVYGYTDGNYRSDDGTLFQHAGDREWVDYYGNHYTTDGTSVHAEKTGNTLELTSQTGALVVVYEYTDGSLRSEDGNLFQSVDGNEYIDYSGNHYFKDYIPEEYQDNGANTENQDNGTSTENQDNGADAEMQNN